MDNKKMIGQRINSALALSGKMQKELAAALGVTDNTVSYYVGGKRTPGTEQLIVISKYLGVSTDYLLGLSDTPSPDIEDQAICQKLGIEGETLEALKFAIKKIKDSYLLTEEDAAQLPFSCATAAELQIIAASGVLWEKNKTEIDFFWYLSLYIEAKVMFDKVNREYEVLYKKMLEILHSHGWTEYGNAREKNMTIREIQSIVGFEEKMLRQMDEYEHLYPDMDQQLYEAEEKMKAAQDKLDLSLWKLQKQLYSMADVIIDLWYERYGDQWQA